MEEPTAPRGRERFGFALVEEKLEAIVRDATAKLEDLVSDARFSKFQDEALADLRDQNFAREPGRVAFQLRLGRTRLSLDELENLESDAIIPLLDSTPGQVQIWSNGRLFGRGALLVVDGKLAVRVESLRQ